MSLVTADMAVSGRVEALSWISRIVLDDSGKTWGSTAAEFQMVNAAEVLDPAAEVRQFFVPGVRGSRKTTDLAAIGLTVLALQAPGLSRSFVIGQDEDQARDLIDLAAEMIVRTPGLDALFTVTGLQIRNIRTGATLTALANDPSAMGKRPYLIIADELAAWPDSKAAKKFWTAMVTAVEKVPGCRLIVLTNAGSPEHWAFKRYEVAVSSVHWRVLDVPAPLPWLDDAALQRARENCLTDAEFERLFLNIWTAEDSRMVDLETVRACVTPARRPFAPERGRRYVAGLDLGWKKDATVLIVAHCEPRAERWRRDLEWLPPSSVDGEQQAVPLERLWKVVVDELRVWQGTRKNPVDLGRVEMEAAQVARAYGATLVYDPREFVRSGQALRASGVAAEEFTFTAQSKAVLTGTLIRLFREQALDLPDDNELVEELVHLNLRETRGGTLTYDHDPGRHDDRATALALAAQHLLAGTKAEAEQQRYAPRDHVVGLDPRTGTGTQLRYFPAQKRWARITPAPAHMQLLDRLASRGDHEALSVLGQSTTRLSRESAR